MEEDDLNPNYSGRGVEFVDMRDWRREKKAPDGLEVQRRAGLTGFNTWIGIPVKLLSITAGMNLNVWVHTCWCLLQSWVLCAFGHECDICALPCVSVRVFSSVVCISCARVVEHRRFGSSLQQKDWRGGTAEMELIYLWTWVCLCYSAVVSAMNHMRVGCVTSLKGNWIRLKEILPPD